MGQGRMASASPWGRVGGADDGAGVEREVGRRGLGRRGSGIELGPRPRMRGVWVVVLVVVGAGEGDGEEMVLRGVLGTRMEGWVSQSMMRDG